MKTIKQQLEWARSGWKRAEEGGGQSPNAVGPFEDWWFWKGYVTALEWVERERPEP